MTGKTAKKSAKVAKKAVAKRVVAKAKLLSGGNPQIAKAYGNAMSNIGDKKYYNRVFGNGIEPALGRTYYAGFSYEF